MAFVTSFVEKFPGNFDVVKGNSAFAAHLDFFVALSSNEDDVSGLSFADGQSDGGVAIGLHGVLRAGALQANHRVIDDSQRVFTARVVGGEDHKIAASSCGFAHQGTLSPVTIAAAAEERDNAAFLSGLRDELSRERGEISQGVVGVRIVHHYGKRLAAINPLKAAGNTSEGSDSFGDRLRVAISGVGRSDRGEDVIDIDFPDQGRPDRNRVFRRDELEACASRGDLHLLRMEVTTRQRVGVDAGASLLADL